MALKRYGIRLLVYLPSQAPGRDLLAMGQLGLGNETMGGGRGTYKMYEMFTGNGTAHRAVTSEGGYLWGTAPDGNRHVEFQVRIQLGMVYFSCKNDHLPRQARDEHRKNTPSD